MSDKMMKICGKNPDGNATAIGMDANGNLKIKRVWESVVQKDLFSGALSDTGAVTTINNALDLAEQGMVSLRFYNTTDSALKVMLYSDMSAATETLLKDINGENFSFTVAADAHTIITPDDLPVLNYLRYLKLKIQPVTEPTTGQLVVRAVTKR